MSLPRVSVGMPVYNGEPYVRAALDTALAQTFGDFELIISDNASTDATPEICREYAARDPRIRYSRNEENLGSARNHNHTIHLATGSYFKWAHADDLCAPEFLAQCVEVMEQRATVVLCYPKTRMIDATGRPMFDLEDRLDLRAPDPVERYRAFHRRFRSGNWWINPMLGLMRTEALRKTRLHGSYYSADIVLLAELALLGEFYELPQRLLYRRRHPGVSNLLSPYAMAIFEDPLNEGRIIFPRWKLLFELARAIHLSPLALGEKLRCLPQCGLWLLQYRKDLVMDLQLALQQIPRLLREKPSA